MMLPTHAILFLMLSSILVLGCQQPTPEAEAANGNAVEVIARADKQRVDVYIDGDHFTSYLYSDYPSSQKKPILYPLRTVSGKDITRGYPFEERAGERVDHPHHVGHWLNYGDVNGYDFWNHSASTPEDRLPRMGTIVHKEVVSSSSGDNQGSLEVSAQWINPDEEVLLDESTRFVFHRMDNMRIVDRITTLTATNGPVSFTDNKEGMIAIRVTRALEHPDDRPVLLTDEKGQPLPEREINNEGVTGRYLSSEGIEGVDVWGTRAEWMLLSGTVQEEEVAVAIIDHPQNPGYPTYWHARGYGLFSANPLGQKALSNGADELNFALDEGASVTFRYRMAILPGGTAEHDVVELTSSFADVM